MSDAPDPGALGPLLLAACMRAAPGLSWRWNVEPHPENCDCPADHVNGMVTSRRLAVADTPNAQLCVFSGDVMQHAWVRLLGKEGQGMGTIQVKGGEHVRSAASHDARIAWVQEVVPRLVAAVTPLSGGMNG